MILYSLRCLFVTARWVVRMIRPKPASPIPHIHASLSSTICHIVSTAGLVSYSPATA